MSPQSGFAHYTPGMFGLSEQGSPVGSEEPSTGSSAASCFRFGTAPSPQSVNVPSSGRQFRKVSLRRKTSSPAPARSAPTDGGLGADGGLFNNSFTCTNNSSVGAESSPAFKQSCCSCHQFSDATKQPQSSPGIFVDKTNFLNCGASPDTAQASFVFGVAATAAPPETPQLKFNAAAPLGQCTGGGKQRPSVAKLKRSPFGASAPAASPMLWSPADVLDIPCNYSWPGDPQSVTGNTLGASSIEALAKDFAHKVELAANPQVAQTTTTSSTSGAATATGEGPTSSEHFVFGSTTTSPSSNQPGLQQAPAPFVFGISSTAPAPTLGSPVGTPNAQPKPTRPSRTRRSPAARVSSGSGGRGHHAQPSTAWSTFDITLSAPVDLPTCVGASGDATLSRASSSGTDGDSSHTPATAMFNAPAANKHPTAASSAGNSGAPLPFSMAGSQRPIGPTPAVDRLHASSEAAKLLGDTAYKRNDFKAAVHEYGNAIALLQASPQSYKTMLAVLYSNRAGAWLMLKQPRAALQDSNAAMASDAKCVRAYLRAITCHTRLGDLVSASRVLDTILERCSASSPHFQELLAKQKSLDMLVTVLARIQSNAGAPQLLAQDKLPEVGSDLAMVMEQMPCSAQVQSACATLLLRLGRHAEALQACSPDSETQRLEPSLRWMAVQVCYQQGELPAALERARALQQLLTGREEPSAGNGQGTGTGAAANGPAVPPTTEVERIIAKLEKLLQLKQAGNSAVQAKKYDAAVEQYSAALAEGAPLVFASVLLGNRAAAHQAAGRWTEAMADCGRARALNPAYAKAYSRLSTLLLEVRRAEAAADALQQMLKHATLASSEQAEAQQRIKQARSKASWQKTPDHYRLLAVDATCQDEDIRKSYRKLALRYHPDKALSNCRFEIALGEYGVAMDRAEVVEKRVQEESSWIFNMVNEAHEELSDKLRRKKVDIGLQRDEDPSTLFTSSTRGYGGSMFGGNDFGYPWATGGSYYSPGAGHHSFPRRPAASSYAPPPSYTRSYAGARPAGPSSGAGARAPPASSQPPPPRASGAQSRAPPPPPPQSDWWRRQYDDMDSNDEQDDQDEFDQY